MTEKKNENFNFATMRDLYENGKCKESLKYKEYVENLIKNRLDCKQYIESFFVPLTNGSHAFIENGKLEMINNDSMRIVYLNRFEDDIKKWYEKKTIPKKLICDINKPRIGEDFVNASAQLARKFKKFDTFSKETQEGVNMMLTFMKNIWANNNDDSLNYLLKWLANLIRGNKNKTALYAKSIEGIGKSTLIDFFVKYVINPDLYAKGDADILITSNNMSILGKILVVFEELPVLNISQWNLCDSKLKDMITGDELNYTDKYEKKLKADNISNFIIITNHKALKRPDGRRYFILDLNTEYQNNFSYFEKLRNKCFNNDVGYAFYCYLMEIDLKSYNSLDMPLTENKKDAIVDLLSLTEKFLKFNYVLKELPIKCTLSELYKQYESYVTKNHPDHKCERLVEFSSNMKNLGLSHKPIGGYNCYRILYETLKQIADKKHWLHELDNDIIITTNKTLHDDTIDDDDYENGVDKKDLSVKMSLLEQYEFYKRKSNELEILILEELNFFNSVIKTITKNHTENIDLIPKQETQKNELLTEQQIRTIKKRQIYDKDKVNGDQVLDYIQNKKLEDTLKLNLDEIFKKHF